MGCERFQTGRGLSFSTLNSLNPPKLAKKYKLWAAEFFPSKIRVLEQFMLRNTALRGTANIFGQVVSLEHKEVDKNTLD